MKHIKEILPYCWCSLAAIAVVACCMVACKDDSLHAMLGPLPQADFAVVKGTDPNSIVVVNKTNMPSIAYWRTSNGLTAKGDSAAFRFVFEGTYHITLTADGRGGIDTLSKEVTIDQNDPTACQGTVQGFIAGCSQKTWKLNPGAGAEGVGPGPGDVSWWSNSAGDVAGGRVCDFNDEWTFHFNADGVMDYDNKGDYFTEDYLGNANNDCDVNADLTDVQKPWASGTFNYQLIENAGTKPELGQLRVIGPGAHIGFPRVTNGADNKTAPVKSITYDIIGMKHDPAGYDLLQLAINEGSADAPVWWTYTLRSY